jgi:hypothetical protein
MGDLSCLGSNERNLRSRGPRGPSERERASHWAGVRWCSGFRRRSFGDHFYKHDQTLSAISANPIWILFNQHLLVKMDFYAPQISTNNVKRLAPLLPSAFFFLAVKNPPGSTVKSKMFEAAIPVRTAHLRPRHHCQHAGGRPFPSPPAPRYEDRSRGRPFSW